METIKKPITQTEANEMLEEIKENDILLVSGYIREHSIKYIVNQIIPNGIINYCIVYGYAKIKKHDGLKCNFLDNEISSHISLYFTVKFHNFRVKFLISWVNFTGKIPLEIGNFTMKLVFIIFNHIY